MQIGDPPQSNRSVKHWVEVVHQLKTEYPGQFGMVGNYSVGVASHIRKGKYPAFVPAHVTDKQTYVKENWQVVTRRTPDGRNDVYVKWIGDA